MNTDDTSTHDEQEIERAFAAYQATVADIAQSGDWGRFADMFTQDASYEEHAYGTLSGREEIRSWVLEPMTAFPGNTMTSVPIAWHLVEASTIRVICEVRNLMPDPGDGSVHETSNLTILTYGGDGLWSREEDIYNPMRFAKMSVRWARVAADHGRLSAEGQEFLKKLGGRSDFG